MKWCSYEETDPQQAVHLDTLVGVDLNIPQTFGAPGFHLIYCFLLNVLNCNYCSWIKYEETSGFTGDICFSLKQPVPLIMKVQNLRDVRWHAAGTLISP